MLGAVEVNYSQYMPANQVLMYNGTHNVWGTAGSTAVVGIDFAVEEQQSPREERNQNFYKGLCNFYQKLDDKKFWQIFEDNYDEGSLVNYKELYEKLRENF